MDGKKEDSRNRNTLKKIHFAGGREMDIKIGLCRPFEPLIESYGWKGPWGGGLIVQHPAQGRSSYFTCRFYS